MSEIRVEDKFIQLKDKNGEAIDEEEDGDVAIKYPNEVTSCFGFCKKTNIHDDVVELEIGFKWKNTLAGHLFGVDFAGSITHFFADSAIKSTILVLPPATCVAMCIVGLVQEEHKVLCYSGFVVLGYVLAAVCLADYYIAIECMKRTSFFVYLVLSGIIIAALGDLFDYDSRLGISIPFAFLIICVQLVDALPPVVVHIRIFSEIFITLILVFLGPAFALRLIPLNEKDFILGDLNGLSHRVIKYNNLQLACEVVLLLFFTSTYDLYHTYVHGKEVYLRIQAEVIRNPDKNDMD